MNIFLISFLLIFFVLYNSVIYYRHRKVSDKIKIRIHVNGTRGKSSVTRLIAAGLREAGIKTLAKVTGTAPNIIYPDATEKPIIRLREKGNIIEQIRIFREAVSVGAEAVVMECMALKPQIQRVSEEKLVRSTLGVITNIRGDHLDVMGPTIRDVLDAVSLTIPRDSVLVTSERGFLDSIKEKASRLNTEVVSAKDPQEITDEMMRGFRYLEHRENVATALSVCGQMGIGEDIALRGMHKCEPDPGVLRTFKIYQDNKYIEFINAFATNDPSSLMLIWQRMQRQIAKDQVKIVLINCRKDRYSRSQQLVEMICHELGSCCIIVGGEVTAHIERNLNKCGIDRSRLFNLKLATPKEVFDKVMSLTQKSSVVFAIGNIADSHGLARGIIEYFKERSMQG